MYLFLHFSAIIQFVTLCSFEFISNNSGEIQVILETEQFETSCLWLNKRKINFSESSEKKEDLFVFACVK